MTTSAGFIVSIEDETIFYEIKNFIANLDKARLIYCTRTNDRLYITSEEHFSMIQRREQK
jgi:hypothetical protein